MNLLQEIREQLRVEFPALLPPKRPSPPSHDPTAIILGMSRNRPLPLPWRQRAEHIFMLGATGSAKTTALIHYLRQGIKKGEGAVLLDPHGNHPDSAYKQLLATTTRPVTLIDFNAPRIVGFNPLHCPEDTDPSVIVGINAAALSVVWEGERFANSPSGERGLKTVLGALVELGLTYCEAAQLIEPGHELRSYAIQHVKDDETRNGLKRLEELANDKRRFRDFEQETIFTRNRIHRLMDAPVTRAMLGQTENTLDIRSLMDEGGILLANLSGGLKVPDATADLFGKVLTNSILFHAKRREQLTPVNVVIDEAHRFLSAAVPTLLAEARKYGVSVCMAMQWLSQATDQTVQDALMKGPGVKICFRLRDAEEAEKIAHTIVPLNLERPVSALIRPTVVGHRRIKLANESESENEADTTQTSTALGKTDSVSDTIGETFSSSHTDSQNEAETAGSQETQSATQGKSKWKRSDDEQSGTESSSETVGTGRNASKTVGKGTADTESYAANWSRTRSHALSRVDTLGEGHTHGKGRSKGASEALEPILEDRPSAVHSMQNELYAAGRMLCSLPTGTAFINFVGEKGPVATLVRVPFLKPVAADFDALRDRFMQSATPLEDALKAIAERSVQSEPEEKPAKKPRVDKKIERGTTW